MQFGLVATCLLALALAACGSGGDSGSGLSIENKLGTARIDGRPERVVALDFPSADAAIALGVVPVAMAEVDYVEGGLQPWTANALGGKRPELLATTSGIPLEKVAALRPDLILATNTYGLSKAYDKLARIAPVVAYAQGEGVDPWQRSAVRIGRALGREGRARELVARIRRYVARARRANPAFTGSTVSFYNFYEGDPWVINTASDFSIRFLSELGFRLPPAVAALKGDGQGRAQISQERLDLLEADVIMATSPDPGSLRAFERSSLFRELDTIKRGAYVSLDLPTATSMAFPSALSVPYSLRQVVPKLAAALE
jgi:iron complex transport system substrate-binding protein